MTRPPPPSEVVVSGRAPVPAGAAAGAVYEVLRRERRRALVSVTFVGRDRMRALHRRFKGGSRATDVLAFPLRSPGGWVVGDIYVCPWAARREARRRRIPLRREILRDVVHGALHVLGYDHPEDEGRVASVMWRRQERYLRSLP